jgi:glyoxalase family protein
MNIEIHHLAAISCDLNKTIDFYGSILGLRVLHKTAPYGGPRVCHFYWEEELRNFLTFYHCPGLRQGQKSANMVQTVSFSVNLSSFGFWLNRLKQFRISFYAIRDPFSNENTLILNDPDGLTLELIFNTKDNRTGITIGNVPDCFSIKGFYKVEITSSRYANLAHLLEDCFRLKYQGAKGKLHRFAHHSHPGSIVDVQDCSENIHGDNGCGMIHHVAFKMQDQQAYAQLTLQMAQVQNSLFYFRQQPHFSSFYFREPEGFLFEVLTRKEHVKSCTKKTKFGRE